MGNRWKVAGAVVGAAVLVVSMVAIEVAQAATVSWNPTFSFVAPLERAPYVTDLQQTTAEVNWATSGTTPGYVEWGPSGTCTVNKVVAGTKLPDFEPNVDTANATTDQVKTSPSDYQYSVELTGLSAGTPYCYEVFTSANVNMLGSGVSQSFTTLDTATSSTPLTFDVVGDLGETNGADESSAYVNEDQAAIDDEMGTSGAKFVITAGDVSYSDGSDTDYGDMTKNPTSATSEVSNIFGQPYWPQLHGLPTYLADGNHGENITGIRTWPEEQTATNDSPAPGTFAFDNYAANSLAPATTSPDDWYAVQDGDVRIYVLDAAWSDGSTYLATTKATGAECAKNPSQCEGYQLDAAEHWASTSPEMAWLTADLAAHPGGIKFAVFHYPLTSMNTDQQTDPYLDSTLEPVLEHYGVSMAFNGHAHTYQRFVPDAGSGQMISYVSGGGGGVLEPVDGNSDKSGLCANEMKVAQVYAIGHDSTAGSSCGQSVPSATSVVPADVYNFLRVTVSGNQITVDPENALGQVFDAQSYTVVNGVTTLNAGGSPPPTTSTTSTSTTSTSTTSTTSTTQGSGGISPVQNASSVTKTVTLPGPTRAGDTLVLSAALDTGATNHITAISGTGLTWNLVVDAHTSGHDSDGEVWYASNVPAGITSVTVTAGAGTDALDLQEFSGLGTAPTVAAGGNSSTSTSASQSQSGTGLAVGFVTGNGSSQTITPVAGWTNQPQVTAGTSNLTSLVEGYEPTTGSATYGGSWATAMYFSVGVAVFSPG
jgi:hypothetical protein